MGRLGAIMMCLALLAAGGCTSWAWDRYPGGPGCYAGYGKSDLVSGAAFIAAATGGQPGDVWDADCQDYAGAMVPVYYPEPLTNAQLGARIKNLAYCWIDSSIVEGTNRTSGRVFCQVSGNRFRIFFSGDQNSNLEIYLNFP